ncbi:hypothetical protein [Chelativorans sp.]|nr:hypothetical protein [Chelativorans sp.]
MAKGQKRSSREVRKPKQEKGAAKVDAPFGSQVKKASNSNDARDKAKSRT